MEHKKRILFDLIRSIKNNYTPLASRRINTGAICDWMARR